MDSLQSVVPRALAELLRRGPLSQGKIELAWRMSVGDALSRVTSVRLQRDGVVEVTAADLRWQRELRHSAHVIAARLKGLLGPDTLVRLSILK